MRHQQIPEGEMTHIVNEPIPSEQQLAWGFGDNSRPAVVVADDHPVVAHSLAHLAKQAGMSVIAVVGSGAECVAAVSTRNPAAVLLDLCMPKLADGLEALADIVAISPETTVVVVSATATPDVVSRVLDAGAKGFISKHVDADEVRSLLLTAMKGRLAVDHRTASALIEARLSPGGDQPSLTPREHSVLAALASGLSNPEIANRLHISRSTAAGVVSVLFEKFSVTDRTALVATAIFQGVLSAADVGIALSI